MSRNPYRYSLPASSFNNSLTAHSVPIAAQYGPQPNYANHFNAIKPVASIPTHSLQNCRPNTVLGSEIGSGGGAAAQMMHSDARMASPSVGGRRPGRMGYSAGLHHSTPTIRRSTVSLHASSSYGGKSSTATTGSSEQLLYDDEQPAATIGIDNSGRSTNATVHATPYYHNPDHLQLHDRTRSYTNVTNATNNGHGAGNGFENEYSINGSRPAAAGGSLRGSNNLTSVDVNGNHVQDQNQFIAYIDN